MRQVALAWLEPSKYWHSSTSKQPGDQQSLAPSNHASIKSESIASHIISRENEIH